MLDSRSIVGAGGNSRGWRRCSRAVRSCSVQRARSLGPARSRRPDEARRRAFHLRDRARAAPGQAAVRRGVCRHCRGHRGRGVVLARGQEFAARQNLRPLPALIPGRHGPCGTGDMKPAQLGSLNADTPPIEEDLALRLEPIFRRCPPLHGFTIHGSSALPEELRSLALEKELVVTDIGVYPFINAEQCEAIYNEIAVALLDFLFERPSAKDVLRGRTFVRTLH